MWQKCYTKALFRFIFMHPAHIQVTNLSKSFQVRGKERSLRSLLLPKTIKKVAVNEVNFSISAGELVGFIGPNGAGKTTTLKMLAGLLYPSSGLVRVLGFEPFTRPHAFLKQITLVMGQKQQLWWELPVYDTFLLNKEIYDIPSDVFQKTMSEFVDLFDVRDEIHQPPRNLSLGQRMKCELMAALLHKPKVLFLDEPTIGLDIVMQQHLRDFVARYNQQYDATIILTSHYMDDVKRLCKRIIIINHGVIVYDGSVHELTRNYVKHKVLFLTFSTPIVQEALAEYGIVDSYEPLAVKLRVESLTVKQVAAALLKKLPIADITIQELDLEAVVRDIYLQKT